MKPNSYPIRWCGVQSGPYPLELLERMLDQGDLCLWHEVLVDGQWQFLGDLLRLMNPPPTPTPPAQTSGPTRRRLLPRLHQRGLGSG